jgi:Zn-dependent peptidase ImmA (M78 family)
MLELFELSEVEPPQIDERLNLVDDTEEAGARIRGWLFSSEEVLSESPFRPTFNAWARLVESKGILVVQVPNVDPREMRGFTISARPYPIIAVNNKDLLAARTFTLIHELIHVLLQLSPTANSGSPSMGRSEPNAGRVERFCNAVAACVLMPWRAVLADEAVINAALDKKRSFDELSSLSKRFGVSNEAMLIRLVTLGLASWESYFSRRASLREREIEDAADGGGFATYYHKKIRQLGRRYISSVLEAHLRRDISSTEASRYLDVKIQYIPKLLLEMEKQE